MSVKRVQEFLLRSDSKRTEKVSLEDIIHTNDNLSNDEIKSNSNELVPFHKNDRKNSDTITGRRVHNEDSLVKCITLTNATSVWEQSESSQMNGIHNMNLEIKAGLCAIVGQVGSGKSTLLNLILGELSLESGSMTVNGTISFASQEPWIFEGSVRNNIVFVEEFDRQRYNKVVELCALDRDFKLLPKGDATIVGEQGSSLSGGQKARVNLARAIYKTADIYLLDDPLSAVDTNVGKHIFERCIEEFLTNKICVLVTHQLQYLTNVQHVVLLNMGKVEAQGPFKTLQKLNKELLTHTQVEGEFIDTSQIRVSIVKKKLTRKEKAF